MADPFENQAVPLSGPATDIVAVTPDDATDLADVAIGLYVGTGGDVAIDTWQGSTVTVPVASWQILPVAVTRVRATGTTASQIFALTIT